MNKNVFLWALYDFANTPLTAAITGLYLAQWLVIDNKIDDIWYGLTFALSTILLLITSPFWGTWSDILGKRMPFIKWLTFALLFFGAALAFVTNSSFPFVLKIIFALVLFFILQYAYQLSLIFFDSLLVKISTPKTRGKISGIGEAFGDLGWLIGPAILLPFATGSITIFGEPGRSQVFLPAVILLAILGLPIIFWFKEKKSENLQNKTGYKVIYQKTIDGVKYLIQKDKNVAIFLLSFMFISDALLTITLYFAIYLDQVYRVSDDTQKYIFLALWMMTAIPSAVVIGKISDKFSIKRISILTCLCMVVAFSLGSFSSAINFIYPICILAGVGFGGFYAVSRVFLTQISPAMRLGEYFGFYATFQRFASIIGPLTWGLITLLLKDYGVFRYRIALFSLVIMMMIGIILLTKVKEKRVMDTM